MLTPYPDQDIHPCIESPVIDTFSKNQLPGRWDDTVDRVSLL